MFEVIGMIIAFAFVMLLYKIASKFITIAALILILFSVLGYMF